VSNLYVTVKLPDPVLTGGPMTAAAGGGAPTAAGAPTPELIQDIKYLPGQVVVPGGPLPELQKWKLSPAGITVLDRDRYVVSNQAHPHMVLQPADPSQPESPVILGAADGTAGIHHGQKTWKVTSPLLDGQIVNTQ